MQKTVFIIVSCVRLRAKQCTLKKQKQKPGIITVRGREMFSWRINTTHWINKPFIIVISLLSAFFLQSFRTAGRKSMTPFTAATMSSKSAASLIWNGWLLVFPNEARLCRHVYQEAAALLVCMHWKFMSLCALICIFPVWNTHRHH